VTVARERSYHPVREWLDLCQWDGISRINRLFIDYFPGRLPSKAARQARDNRLAYYESVATCFMVGAVARIIIPGVKVDCLPVLIGNQGWNKSQAVQALMPYTEWFSDDLSTALIDRDTKESLTGKWLIELAEFPHIRREIERVKAFFSRQFDRYRRAYATGNRDWGRQCAFIATANELEFIDHTGNRRFWPIPLRAPADPTAVERDRDQLWAEAMHLYHEGYRWWLPPSIEAIAATFQATFLQDEPMEDKVAQWLVGDYPPRIQLNGVVKGERRSNINGEWPPFTTTIALRGIGYSSNPDDRGYPTRSDEMRMSRVLKRLGYRQSHTTVNGIAQRWWFPVTDAPDDD
jgi:predicted P-loop ATPase